MKLSVIILAHNNEDSIKKCLDSIVSNTILPYEIIIVDNLSSDGSLDLVKAYLNYPIKIIQSKKNHIGYARRLGVKKATGDYILFVDADDYVDSNLFYRLSLCDGYDVIRFNPVCVNKGKYLYQNKFVYQGKKEFFNGYDALRSFSSFSLRYGVFWIYCFKNKNLNIKKFKIYEDTASIPDFISQAKSVICLDYYGYYYVINELGYTHQISKEEKEKYFKKTCRYLIKKYHNHKDIRLYYEYHWNRKKKGHFKKTVNY